MLMKLTLKHTNASTPLLVLICFDMQTLCSRTACQLTDNDLYGIVDKCFPSVNIPSSTSTQNLLLNDLVYWRMLVQTALGQLFLPRSRLC